MVGVATLCSDAGEVNEELRLGLSGSTSLDDVGPCWLPSSLDELGPCGATTGSVVTELWVDWIYPSWFELELQLCEAFMLTATLAEWRFASTYESEVRDISCILSFGNYSVLNPDHCFGNDMRNPG